ncbi:MAG TPA: SufD family Fe-S cluster assembly protein, partial [Micromonosporaceae bacterium]|nr:SufD family Fe-S cluster assembly protein [Micromonosporaceae bacterium]
MTQNVQEAVESSVASHLHPEGSFDVADHPVPTGREEVWRFTPVKRLAPLFAGEPSDGHLTWKYQVPEGVTVSELGTQEAIRLGVGKPLDRLAALAVANSGGAVFIDIEAERELREPLVFQLTGENPEQVVWGHIVLRLGAHARGTVVFEHTGAARYASSVSLLVGDGAELDLVSVQLWDDQAIHTGQISARVGRDARVRSFQGSLGGGLIRIMETTEYAGPGGEVMMNGIYFASGAAEGRPAQHIEHRLFVDHNAPHTRSKVD